MGSVSETFVGTAGTELAAFDSDWTEHTSYTSGSMILTDANRVRASSSAGTAYWHSWTPAGPNYKVAVDWYCMTSVSGWVAYVCGRVNTAANTMYVALAWPGNGYRLYRVVSGTSTQIGSTSAKTFSAATNYNIILEMEDSGTDTIVRLYAEGDTTPKITYTDAAANRISATGKAGIRALMSTGISDTTGWHATSFSAEDLGGGATTSSADPATFTITGSAATALYNRVSAADPAAFTLTGAAATAIYGRVSNAEPGTFTITGVAAEGVYTPAGAYTSIASPGAFTITGFDASVSRTYISVASPASYAITGIAAFGVYRSNDTIYPPSSFAGVTNVTARDTVYRVKTKTPMKRIKI